MCDSVLPDLNEVLELENMMIDSLTIVPFHEDSRVMDGETCN